MIRVEPIRDGALLAVCTYLHRVLNPNVPILDWMTAFQHPWCAEKPNNGFMLIDHDRIVGVLGAIYSDQMIRGRPERFCNLTSWMVEEEFRSESMSLMRAVLSQKGYHFTSYTPSPGLVDVYRGLRFLPLDARQWMVPCLPWPNSAGVVRSEPAEIERALPPPIAKVYRDHAGLPGIVGVALGRTDSLTLVLYRRRRRRRHLSVEILYVSDAAFFARHHRTMASLLWSRERALTFTIARRFLLRRPALALETADPQERLFLSKTLGAGDAELIYSEVVALDPPRVDLPGETRKP